MMADPDPGGYPVSPKRNAWCQQLWGTTTYYTDWGSSHGPNSERTRQHIQMKSILCIQFEYFIRFYAYFLNILFIILWESQTLAVTGWMLWWSWWSRHPFVVWFGWGGWSKCIVTHNTSRDEPLLMETTLRSVWKGIPRDRQGKSVLVGFKKKFNLYYPSWNEKKTIHSA